MIKNFTKKNRLVILSVMIVLFLLNTLYYYGNLYLSSLLENFIFVYNILVNLGYEFIKTLFMALLEEKVFITIIIGIFVVLIIDKLKEVEVLKDITSFEFKDFKIAKNKAIDHKQIEDTKANSEDSCIEKDIFNNKKNNNIDSTIESLLIDSPFLASIIDAYLKHGKKLSVNLNMIPYKITLKEISKIFEYKLKANSIEIVKMKPELEDNVIDTFRDLIEKGIIYVE